MKYPVVLFKQIILHVIIAFLVFTVNIVYRTHDFFLLSGCLLGTYILFKGLVLWLYTHFKLYFEIEGTCIEVQKNKIQHNKTIVFQSNSNENYSFTVPIKSSFKIKERYLIYYTYTIENELFIPNRILGHQILLS